MTKKSSTFGKPNFTENENGLSSNSLYCDLSVIRVYYTSELDSSQCSEEESGSEARDGDNET